MSNATTHHKPTRHYTLEITYTDGMVARFDYTPQELLFEMAQRILANEAHANVKTWKITPFRLSVGNQDEPTEEPYIPPHSSVHGKFEL